MFLNLFQKQNNFLYDKKILAEKTSSLSIKYVNINVYF